MNPIISLHGISVLSFQPGCARDRLGVPGAEWVGGGTWGMPLLAVPGQGPAGLTQETSSGLRSAWNPCGSGREQQLGDGGRGEAALSQGNSGHSPS